MPPELGSPPEEAALISAVDRHLLAATGVVVDDVVLRSWANGQQELTHLLLSAAITAAGGTLDERDLWQVARAVAFGKPIGDRTD